MDLNNIEKIIVLEPIIYGKTITENDILEIKSLIDSADAECVHVEKVKVREISSATFIGSGKLLEIRDLIEKYNANSILFDGVLTPSQTTNISEILDCKVIDRTTLILDIFAKHAVSDEGKIQVELAQLNYTYPRLKGLGTELSRLGGGIGTRGPGETKLETDRRHIKTRILNLKRQIEELKKRRDSQNERREKNSSIVISLVGYTNVGKSTLLNLLTGSNVLAQNKLFATLDTTVRKCKFGDYDTLLVDTVGFIKNIPTDLVDAFRSTLESAVNSQVNVIVCDATSDYEKQTEVALSTLKDLNATAPYILVLNKCDNMLDKDFPLEYVKISAKTGEGIDVLKEKICQIIKNRFISKQLKISYDKLSEFLALTKFLENYSAQYLDDYVLVDLTVKREVYNKFIKFE